MNKWIVNVKGAAEKWSFEISVVRESNLHGIRSYGWFGDDKLLITHNGGPCQVKLTKKIWDRQIKLAQEIADELNIISANQSAPPTKPAP